MSYSSMGSYQHIIQNKTSNLQQRKLVRVVLDNFCRLQKGEKPTILTFTDTILFIFCLKNI
jgi:hypothetical protein